MHLQDSPLMIQKLKVQKLNDYHLLSSRSPGSITVVVGSGRPAVKTDNMVVTMSCTWHELGMGNFTKCHVQITKLCS